MNSDKRERFEQLMMAAVDHELSKDEQEELDSILAAHPQWQDEIAEFRKLKEVTQEMKIEKPGQEVWDTYWINVYNRIERRTGWILFSIGAIILITFGVYHAIVELIADDQMPLIAKLGLLGLVAGLVILLVSVIREKWFMHKKDRYKEVLR